MNIKLYATILGSIVIAWAAIFVAYRSIGFSISDSIYGSAIILTTMLVFIVSMSLLAIKLHGKTQPNKTRE